MSRPSGYPPSHRSLNDPQPECCELCGLHVGGVHLALATAEGLEGYYVCDVTPGCRTFRSIQRWDDRMTATLHTAIGNSRVYPSGSSVVWDA